METPRVLFIDDEIELIRNLSEILRQLGYEVSTASGGERGLSAIRDNAFDVVVLDLRMPGISGLDVLRQIRPDLQTSPEVIILTGFASMDSGLEGLQHGAFDYLTKPVKIKDLVERITQAWERKKQKALRP